MTELTFVVSRVDRPENRDYWRLTNADTDTDGLRMYGPLGLVSSFADDLAVKLAADERIRKVADANRKRITAGPVWTPDDDGRFRAAVAWEPLLNRYKVAYRYGPEPTEIRAARAIVTDGGALVFIDQEGQATQAFSVDTWTSFTLLDPPAPAA